MPWRRTSTWPGPSPRSAAPPWRGDGHSLLPVLLHRPPAGVAQRGAGRAPRSRHGQRRPRPPDGLSGNPTTYEAMRTPRYLYVEYADGEREFYDLRTRPVRAAQPRGSSAPPQVGSCTPSCAALESCQGERSAGRPSHVARLRPPDVALPGSDSAIHRVLTRSSHRVVAVPGRRRSPSLVPGGSSCAQRPSSDPAGSLSRSSSPRSSRWRSPP